MASLNFDKVRINDTDYRVKTNAQFTPPSIHARQDGAVRVVSGGVN